MTEDEAHQLQRRAYAGWPETLAEALAHPLYARLLKARIAVANAYPNKSFPRRRSTDFDWKKAQGGDTD